MDKSLSPSILNTYLENLVVVDLSTVLAGPAVGQFFAELGARVIKVENPKTQGDVTRRWQLPTESAENDISAYFSSVNWGKQSIALDMDSAEHQTFLHKLIDQADIVIVNFKAGDAERYNVDYDTLSQINPRLIYAHITAYGSEDTRVGYDAIIQAESGFTYLNGESDGPPTKMPVALIDVLTAHQIKEGVLLALLKRQLNGKGSYVSASLMQSAVASLVNQATNWLVGNVIPQRMGSEHPNIAPYGKVYTAGDGKPFVIAVGSQKQFAALCQICSLNILQDARFATNSDRVKNRRALDALLSMRFQTFLRADLLEKFAHAAIPAGPINDMGEVFEHPAAQAAVMQCDNFSGLRSIAFEMTDLPLRHLSPPPHFNADWEAVVDGLMAESAH